MTKPNLTDEQLVVLIRDEDPQLFREIIRRYQAKLLRYVEYLVSDTDQAADIVQEALIKAFQNLQSFNTKKKFSSWMYRIAHNQAMNVVTRQKSQQSWDEALEVADTIDLEDDLIRQELQLHAQACLAQMPIKHREPLSLFYLEEKSYQEISDILRLPMGTVSIRIKRAKAMMKAICQKK